MRSTNLSDNDDCLSDIDGRMHSRVRGCATLWLSISIPYHLGCIALYAFPGRSGFLTVASLEWPTIAVRKRAFLQLPLTALADQHVKEICRASVLSIAVWKEERDLVLVAGTPAIAIATPRLPSGRSETHSGQAVPALGSPKPSAATPLTVAAIAIQASSGVWLSAKSIFLRLINQLKRFVPVYRDVPQWRCQKQGESTSERSFYSCNRTVSPFF